MNWEYYLLQKKCPIPPYAHLGSLLDKVSDIYDLSKIPEDTKILYLTTPLKKFKLSYSNWDSLKGNKHIEAICLTDIDQYRVEILSSLPNLKYLEITCNKQDVFPDLSSLSSLQVLILANITRVENIAFLMGLSQLKTLYIYDFKHLYDLSPLTQLTQLQELYLQNGGMNGVGQPIKSMQPLSCLHNLEYLCFLLTVENKNYDVSALYSLKKLKQLSLLPRFLKKGVAEQLKQELPLVDIT